MVFEISGRLMLLLATCCYRWYFESAMRVLLIILDGFGLGKKYKGNAYFLAEKPNLSRWFAKYPWYKLKASGNAVGAPEGTQGGSEVGHFTIGAGRRVWQSLETINRSIKNKSFFRKKPFLEACRRIREANRKNQKAALHLIGMISDQGVHSHINHLFALLELAKKEKAFPVFIHAILDGRDVPEKSAKKFILRIIKKIKALGLSKPMFKNGPQKARIASLVGRYYAMDRDMNFGRTEKAYNLYTLGKGREEKDPLKAINDAYQAGIKSDYYIKPIILNKNSVIKDKDAVILWNFRTDRERQLAWALTGEKPPKETGISKIGFTPKKIARPFVACMGPFSEKAKIAFPAPVIKKNLSEVLSKRKIRQLRIAETEKYAHVTFFFNSQTEKPFPLEKRILIDSPKTPSYAQKPEMSAFKITNRLIKELKKRKYGFVAANFANCDLVGHSGNLKAAVKAVEVIDECLGRIIETAKKYGYAMLVTGDHGNVEYMKYENGEPCPSHTLNPVPIIMPNPVPIGKKHKMRKHKIRKNGGAHGELQDIAPTILKIMDIPKPKEMTGKSLL